MMSELSTQSTLHWAMQYFSILARGLKPTTLANFIEIARGLNKSSCRGSTPQQLNHWQHVLVVVRVPRIMLYVYITPEVPFSGAT